MQAPRLQCVPTFRPLRDKPTYIIVCLLLFRFHVAFKAAMLLFWGMTERGLKSAKYDTHAITRNHYEHTIGMA